MSDNRVTFTVRLPDEEAHALDNLTNTGYGGNHSEVGRLGIRFLTWALVNRPDQYRDFIADNISSTYTRLDEIAALSSQKNLTRGNSQPKGR